MLASPLAPGNDATLAELRDPARRPTEPYAPLEPSVLDWSPPSPVALAPHLLLANLRRSRRGAAPGPSGHTAEIVRLLLDDPAAAESLHAVAARLACAQLPLCASQALGLGRLIAVRKPSGSVRGIVVGDFLRRLVARTLAQQFGSAFDLATRPHQYALTTRAGAEALAHTLQVQCDQDPTLTVLSVDGVGAFDLISRAAMLEALRPRPAASSPSSDSFSDQRPNSCGSMMLAYHSVLQAEGGEQGDPLMPAFFALALPRPCVPSRPTPCRAKAFGHSSMTYTCPARRNGLPTCCAASKSTCSSMLTYASMPRRPVCGVPAALSPLAFPPSPSRSAWVGDTSLPPDERGLRVLGTPLGTDEYVAAYVQTLSAQHRAFLEVLPSVPDLQVAWLLLFFCASPRAQYVLRALPPALTAAFAFEHDRGVLLCLAQLLQVDPGAGDPLPDLTARRVHLALRHGGLGLRSAAAHAPAAYFASWADTMPAVLSRDRALCKSWLRELQGGASNIRSLAALQGCAVLLAEQGFHVPPWANLLAAPPSPDPGAEDEPVDLTRGWQRLASRAVDDTAAAHFWPLIDSASQAMLESQAGPFAARVFTALPPEFRLEPAFFRVLLLRRLRLPLPLDSARCRCRARLDQYGDHRAACPRVGILRSRGIPLERAAARVCREAGATVATNVLLRDLNVVVDRQDDRCLEVIANGLQLWGGVQLAVDTTLVSPLDSLGFWRVAAHAPHQLCCAARV